ncbi:hypothetical protein DMENIID0001_090260 [Sergentomyia squamirostris]
MELYTAFLVILSILIPLNEAVNCDKKPTDLEYMMPETCWYGPTLIDYDAQFDCETDMEANSGKPYSSEGSICVSDCLMKENDVLKDMKLNKNKFLEFVKKRTPGADFTNWETAIKAAIEKCFPLADQKLTTLNAKDYDNVKKCNPVPQKLYTCLGAQILVGAPAKEVGMLDEYCTRLRDFYKTCEFTF